MTDSADPMALVCPYCGARLPAGSRFCLTCGRPLGMGPAASASTPWGPSLAPYAPPARRSRTPIIVGLALVGLVACLGLAGLGGLYLLSPSATAAPTLAPATSAANSTSSTSPAPTGSDLVSASSFDSTYDAMARLQPLTAQGSGMVGVVVFEDKGAKRSALTKAFSRAGYTSSDYKIDVAVNDANMLSYVQADVAAGAKVLIVEPPNGDVGKQIQSLAAQSGVRLIATFGSIVQGKDSYFVDFDNVGVGRLMGWGLEECVRDWSVSKPQVYELDGGKDIDPNAVAFANGYNDAIWGKAATPLSPGLTNSAGYTLVGEEMVPGWDPNTAGTIFAAAYQAHPEINATIVANDAMATAVIGVLKGHNVRPWIFPVTGQDATFDAMVNILEGYQCGTVYKPFFVVEQAAVALATYLRAGLTPPSGLVNGSVPDPSNSAVTVPMVRVQGFTWVTPANMNATVVHDGAVSAADICNAVGPDPCAKAGITP
jgi:D-xylose transport system substrate-binding protein